MRIMLLLLVAIMSIHAAETPPLQLSTSLLTKGRHVAQHAFDGNAATCFASDQPVQDGDDVTITLPSASTVDSLQIITGNEEGKDRLHFAVLEISSDGNNYRYAAQFKDGSARVDNIQDKIVSFRIRITGGDGARLALNEIIISGFEKPVVAIKTRVHLHYETARDAKGFAEKSQEIVEQYYPLLYSDFDTTDGPAPLTNIHLWFRAMDGVAHATNRNEIHISEKWVTKQAPNDYGMVVHELFHLVQAYTGGGEGWLTEGLADYVRHRYFEPQANWGKPDPQKAKYTDAYKTTALFLEWITDNHKKDIVLTLNAASRAKNNVRETFSKETGKDIDALWQEYISTLR